MKTTILNQRAERDELFMGHKTKRATECNTVKG